MLLPDSLTRVLEIKPEFLAILAIDEHSLMIRDGETVVPEWLETTKRWLNIFKGNPELCQKALNWMRE